MEKPITLASIIFLCGIYVIACGRLVGIPEEIKKYVFERSAFSKPITLNLPPGDSPNQKNDIIKLWKESQNATLMPLIFYGGKSLNIDKNIMNFLAKNNYAKTETMTLNVRNSPTQFIFLYYFNKITPYLKKSDQSGVEIILAKRKLKSIGHTNNYIANMLGINVKVCAFTFTYFMENKLPGLPKLNKEFEGKAKAYLDPDDGKWKMENVALSDRGEQEYLSLLTHELIIDSRKMQQNFKAFNFSYQYGQGSVSLIFNIEGGVPPYKYGWPAINGILANNLLSAYRVARQGYNGPLYRIDFQDVKEGSGAITIAMDDEFQGFGWPPDLSFPLNIKIKVVDASSPPKVATLETVIDSGPRVSAAWRNKILDFDYWIEKHGQKMSASPAGIGAGREAR